MVLLARQLPGQHVDQPDRDGSEPGLHQPGPEWPVAQEHATARQEEQDSPASGGRSGGCLPIRRPRKACPRGSCRPGPSSTPRRERCRFGPRAYDPRTTGPRRPPARAGASASSKNSPERRGSQSGPAGPREAEPDPRRSKVILRRRLGHARPLALGTRMNSIHPRVTETGTGSYAKAARPSTTTEQRDEGRSVVPSFGGFCMHVVLEPSPAARSARAIGQLPIPC